MIACLQRVDEASVSVGGRRVGAIGRGLAVLLGVERGDAAQDADRLAARVARYRCFASDDGVKPMDRSLLDLGAGALVVSQFTLCASTRKGLRPGFDRAARPELAAELYERFAGQLETEGVTPVARGVFRSHMRLALVLDGPVTLWLATRPS